MRDQKLTRQLQNGTYTISKNRFLKAGHGGDDVSRELNRAKLDSPHFDPA
jgi:hypothetical protein